jgi:hypothetical protein
LDPLNLNLVHPRRFYGLQRTNQQFQRVFHIWQIVKSNEGSRSYERLGLIFSFGWLVRGLLGLRDCEVDWT